MDRLRILVVLPLYGGSLPLGKYCVEALRKLGHSVRSFDGYHLFDAYRGIRKLDLSPLRINALTGNFLKLVSQAVYSMVEEQKPQLVIALAQAPMDRQVLLRLRKDGVKTVMWFVEDYRVFNYWLTMAPLYDAFAVIQKEPFLDELRKIGQKHAFYLPLAALPEFHRPLELSQQEKQEYGSDISFMGAGYPNRRLAFHRLADRDFKIWGSDWDGEQILAKNIQRNGERIEAEESVKIYNASKINLNLHSSFKTDNLVSGGDFVNPRTFELAAMGAFQLVDRRSLLPELFAQDELATFENIQEFYRLIDYFLAHPDEREEYARKARIRVLEEHTYEKRMAALLDYMQDNFGPLGNEQAGQSSWADNLDPQLRDAIIQQATRLGLAADASFDDVVAQLRRQSGKLDEIETAILFLDEWRKQYGK